MQVWQTIKCKVRNKMRPAQDKSRVLSQGMPRRPAILGTSMKYGMKWGSCHKRQNPQALTPQAPIRNRQTTKVGNTKGLNRNTIIT